MNKPTLDYIPEEQSYFLVTVTLDANTFEFGKVLTGIADKTISEILDAVEDQIPVYASVLNGYVPFIAETQNGVRFGVKQDFDGVLLDFILEGNIDDAVGEYWTCSAFYYPHTNANIFDLIYPVGSIYMSVNAVNPGTLFGGTWEQIKDTFLLSAGDTYTNADTGGTASQTIPSHRHVSPVGKRNTNQQVLLDPSKITGATHTFASTNKPSWTTSSNPTSYSDVQTYYTGYGGEETIDLMPPYLVVNVWKRTG